MLYFIYNIYAELGTGHTLVRKRLEPTYSIIINPLRFIKFLCIPVIELR